MKATGAPTVPMLCPLTKVICLLKIGTAMTMQTGKGTTQGFKDLTQVGNLSLPVAGNQSGAVVTFLKAERGCKTKAGELKVQGHPIMLLVGIVTFCLAL